MSKAEKPKLSKEFFKKLEKLFKEYDVTLGGCGCCGSPYIRVGKEYFENILIFEDGKISY